MSSIDKSLPQPPIPLLDKTTFTVVIPFGMVNKNEYLCHSGPLVPKISPVSTVPNTTSFRSVTVNLTLFGMEFIPQTLFFGSIFKSQAENSYN